MARVYLDMCALCRPLDDQLILRNRLESVAGELILSHVRNGQLELVISPAHEIEINRIKDAEERRQIQSMLRSYGTHSRFDVTRVRDMIDALSLSV
jgi:hypothetical protein